MIFLFQSLCLAFQAFALLAFLLLSQPFSLFTRSLFRVGIDDIHGGADALRNRHLNSFDRPIFGYLKQNALIGWWNAQYIVFSLHVFVRWMTDANAQAWKNISMQVMDDIAHAIVPGGASPGAELQLPNRKIEFVVND